jgi:hypothetical protein
VQKKTCCIDIVHKINYCNHSPGGESKEIVEASLGLKRKFFVFTFLRNSFQYIRKFLIFITKYQMCQQHVKHRYHFCKKIFEGCEILADVSENICLRKNFRKNICFSESFRENM